MSHLLGTWRNENDKIFGKFLCFTIDCHTSIPFLAKRINLSTTHPVWVLGISIYICEVDTYRDVNLKNKNHGDYQFYFLDPTKVFQSCWILLTQSPKCIKYPTVSPKKSAKKVSENVFSCPFLHFVWEIWWPLQETEWFSWNLGDSWINRETELA